MNPQSFPMLLGEATRGHLLIPQHRKSQPPIGDAEFSPLLGYGHWGSLQKQPSLPRKLPGNLGVTLKTMKLEGIFL